MPDDVDKWLSAARPRTAADQAWAASPAGEETLAGIHRATWRAPRKLRRPRRLWVGSLGVAAGAAAVTVVALAGSPTPAQHPGGTPRLALGPRPATMALAAYDSCADMLAGLRAHTAAHVGPYGLPNVSPGPLFAEKAADSAMRGATASGAATESAPAHSTTNVQEQGVDEPDIVKSDGNRIVTVTDGVLRVVDTAARKITGTLDLTAYANWQSAQLLVAGNRALVMLGSSAGYSYGPMATDSAIGMPGSVSSTYLLVNLSGQPGVLGMLHPTGGYVDARMTGSTVRLVVDSTPTISFPADARPGVSDAQRTQRNRAIVRQAGLAAWLPTYDVTAGGIVTHHAVPCQRVSHPADYTGASMLTIYTIDLDKGLGDGAPVSLATDGDTVYATATSLYVASNPNWWGCGQQSCATPAQTAQRSEIHRFDISTGAPPVYLGSGSVPGRLLSQYSLSDYQGHLRVATTSGESIGKTETAVYVLDADTLKITGQVGGLGKGERIYAVRFLGPLGYVVTFQQLDPLYVLDLADPAVPRLAGELTITGYSDYLHPAGAGRLIGVGQEGDSQGRVAGLQVSLFDVRGPGAPHLLSRVVRSAAPGEQTLDPHAFLYWPATGLVVVPIQSWQRAESGKALVLKVNGAHLDQVGLISNPPGTNGWQLGIQRSMVVGTDIWTMSTSGLKVSDPTTLKGEAWIAFS